MEDKEPYHGLVSIFEGLSNLCTNAGLFYVLSGFKDMPKLATAWSCLKTRFIRVYNYPPILSRVSFHPVFECRLHLIFLAFRDLAKNSLRRFCQSFKDWKRGGPGSFTLNLSILAPSMNFVQPRLS